MTNQEIKMLGSEVLVPFWVTYGCRVLGTGNRDSGLRVRASDVNPKD